jgi:hypothetical protein
MAESLTKNEVEEMLASLEKRNMPDSWFERLARQHLEAMELLEEAHRNHSGFGDAGEGCPGCELVRQWKGKK